MYLIRKSYFFSALVGLAWVGMVAVGLGAMLKYESTPGASGSVPSTWPSGTHLQRATDSPTLIMVAHPKCPCTAASVNELAQIMAAAPGKISARVLFWQPAGGGADWDHTALWQSVAAIPGVEPIADVDGHEARLLGAETSGHTLLFAADGRLLFNGGITQSRGHSGDNVGVNSIIALLKNARPQESRSLVFGCSLFNRKTETAAKALCSK